MMALQPTMTGREGATLVGFARSPGSRFVVLRKISSFIGGRLLGLMPSTFSTVDAELIRVNQPSISDLCLF